jgi:autotransporter-associated beta strand protein
MTSHRKNRFFNRASLPGNSLQCAAVASLLVLSTAHASVVDWKSNGVSTNWATGSNWVGDVAPVADLTTDIASFNQTSYAYQPTSTIPNSTNVPPITPGEINGIQSGDGATATADVILSTGTGNGRLNLGNSGIVMYANSGKFTLGNTGSQGVTILADQAWINNSASLLTVNALSVDNGSSANPVITLSGSGTGGYSFGKIEASAVTNSIVPGVLSLRFNRTGAGTITLTSGNTLLKGFQIGDGSTATVPTTLTTGTGNNRPVVGDGGIVMNANSGAFNFGATGSQGVTFVTNQTWQNNSSSLLTVSSLAVDNGSSNNPVLTLSGSGTGGYSMGKIENSSGSTGILSLVINRSGAGVVDLTGNSTFTGGTTLTAGTLQLSHNSALGTGTFTINGGTIASSASARTTANPQVWGGDWTFGGANNWSTGVSTVSLNGNVEVTVSGTGIPNVNSVISGTGDLTKAGSGALILGNASSYVGQTIVNEGTLEIDFGNNSVATSSGQQSNKIPATSPVELGGGTLTVTGGLSRAAWTVVPDTAWTAVTPVPAIADRYELTFATLPAVSVGQPVTGTGITGGVVQGISATTPIVTIDVTPGSAAPAATGTDFATSVTTAPWTAAVTTGLPSGQYQLTFASSIGVTPGQPVTATGLTGAYVVRTDGKNIIVVSSTAPAATGTDFAIGAFAPDSSQTLASTALVTGDSTMTAALNGGNGVMLDLGAITRAVGSTVQLNLPTGTPSAANGILTSNGSASAVLLENGVAYATAGANNWAAKDATGTFIEIASSNLNEATLLGVPNSTTVTGINTVLAADSAPITMRSNLDEALTITANGFTITTGGVLVGSAVTASNGLTITGGTLKSAATAANQDLVVINNGAGSLTIDSAIANSTAGATGLTKSGIGTVKLGGNNSYTGSTVINKGVLSLTTNTSLANSSVIVIGKDPDAVLNLNFTGTEYVAALTINGVAQPDGIYSSSDPSGRITGDGTLTVGGTVTPTTPTITTAPTATAITVGQTLTASILSGGVASVPGTFAFTTPSTAPAVGTASQPVTFTPNDTVSYTTATTTASVTVYASYANAFGTNSPTAISANGLANLVNYAFGANSPGAAVTLPASALTADALSLRAAVRTNDPTVTTVGESGTNLAQWSPTTIPGVAAQDQTGATPGETQMQIFSAPRGTNSKLFLLLEAIQSN